MKKVYIQPEAELLNLAILEDFLNCSPDTSADVDDNTIQGEGDPENGYEGDKWE